jgi:hypothetical protein
MLFSPNIMDLLQYSKQVLHRVLTADSGFLGQGSHRLWVVGSCGCTFAVFLLVDAAIRRFLLYLVNGFGSGL